VWRRHLQRAVSGGSVLTVLVEHWRQHGSSATMAGSVAEALAAQGQQQQRSGGGDSSGGSSAAASSGEAGSPLVLCDIHGT
jgi:hypothetical protein